MEGVNDHYIVDEKHYNIDSEDNSAVVVTPSPDFWQPALPAWEQLRRDWWGHPEKIRQLHEEQNHILTVSPLLIDDGFSCLVDTTGKMYVRQEICDMYDEVCSVFDAHEKHGVVFTGQPGCGKSCSLVYFLIKRLSRKQTTLFTTSPELTYLFAECGTFVAESRKIENRDIIKWKSRKFWSLIDWALAEEPPIKLTLNFFPVQASSPDRNRYRCWVKEGKAAIRYMSPWSVADLVQALQLDVRAETDKILNCLSEALDVVAPCPRDILDYHYDRNSILTNQSNAIQQLLPANITSIFAGSPVANNHVPHRIALILVKDGHRDYSIDFVSPQVERAVVRQIRHYALDSAVALYSKCSPVPSAAILTSWIFEAIVINVTRRANGRLKEFVKMDPYEGARFAFDGRGHYPGGDTIVQQFGVERKRDTVNLGPKVQLNLFKSPSPPSALPIGDKELVIYDDLSEVTFDSRKYYVPAKRTNPLFDAFFYQVVEQDECVRLWIIQAPTAKTYGDAETGYALIEELVKKVPVGYVVERVYVLAVPLEHRVSLPRVVWDMPDGWNVALQGQVFVQFVDVKMSLGGDRPVS